MTRRPPPRRLLLPRPGLPGRPRRHQTRTGGHRQRGELPRPDLHRDHHSLASRHQRIRPHTPRHNGKVERYNRILVEECLYARTYTSKRQFRDAVAVWNHRYNYHRPPHRLPQPASHHPRPSTRHQTHDLIQCSRATRSMPRSGRASRSGQSHHIHTLSKRSV